MQEYYFADRGIAYRRNEFRPDRETLVWIHGLSGSLSAWFEYEKRFEQYNLLTFDLRGHGKSDRPRRYKDYELKMFATDMYELFEYLRIEKCILISHSFGALVALEFIHAYHTRVSSTIFLSPTAYLDTTRWSTLVRSIGTVIIAFCRVLPFSGKRRRRVDYSIFKYTGDWDLRRIVRDVYTTTIHSYMYCLGQAYAKNYNTMWKNISVPTLIIHGSRDGYVPMQNSVRLSKEIVTSELVILNGANHIIVLNNMNTVSKNIERFLTSKAID